jgi:deoxyhypusine synthase
VEGSSPPTPKSQLVEILNLNIRDFLETHFRHFNAATVVDASRAYAKHIDQGGRMMITLAGAMSTAELGLSLAEMIRNGKVHALCTTGANLEEDLFNLIAHDHYVRIPHYRDLTAHDEKELERQGLNRVTDTCIPELEAFRRIEKPILELWRRAEAGRQRFFPYEYFYQLIREGWMREHYQIDPAHSWLVAAAEADLPIFVPGWEDSTLGNVFVSHVLQGHLGSYEPVKSGLETMGALAEWYVQTTMGKRLDELPELSHEHSAGAVAIRAIPSEQAERTIGFFQIGGGIAGDFPICVVPLIHQDLRRPCPYWGYFCQISDSTTSYGSYSGAIPNEKITWGKLDENTPRFVIESDATIVAPLMFAHILGW